MAISEKDGDPFCWSPCSNSSTIPGSILRPLIVANS